jgi:predicted kinase
MMRHRQGGSLQARIARILEAARRAPGGADATPTLVLTVGLPGTGKSTFARRLAGRIDATVLESDALRRLLFGEPDYSAAESQRLFDAIRGAARVLLADSRDVIVDATNLKERDRQPFFTLAEETGARLLVLRFSAPRLEVERRLELRRNGADLLDRSSAGIAVYEMMAEREEPLTVEHLVIDTSDAAATESLLDRVVEACRPLAAGTPGMGG